jgi:PBP1b-binding outer membrane lipoprotein LpoB
MRKYVLLILIAIISLLGLSQSRAASVSPLQDPQAKMMVLVERPAVQGNVNKTKKILAESIDKMFAGKNVDLIDQDETNMIARTYAEDHALRVITSHDLQAIGIQAKADYVTFIQLRAENVRASAGFFNTSIKMTVLCRTRIMNVKTGEYVASGESTIDGKSRAILGGVPSVDHAFNDALTQCLDKIRSDIDAHTITFPIVGTPAKILPDLTK